MPARAAPASQPRPGLAVPIPQPPPSLPSPFPLLPVQLREFNGREYLLEESITGEVAIVKAWRADPFGNLQFRGTARNFNPDAATAGKFTIAEVDEIVPLGSITPEDVHLSGGYIDAVVLTQAKKEIERKTVRSKEAPAPLGGTLRAALNRTDAVRTILLLYSTPAWSLAPLTLLLLSLPPCPSRLLPRRRQELCSLPHGSPRLARGLRGHGREPGHRRPHRGHRPRPGGQVHHVPVRKRPPRHGESAPPVSPPVPPTPPLH